MYEVNLEGSDPGVQAKLTLELSRTTASDQPIVTQATQAVGKPIPQNVVEQSLYFAESSDEDEVETKLSQDIQPDSGPVELDESKMEFIIDEVIKVEEALSYEISNLHAKKAQ